MGVKEKGILAGVFIFAVALLFYAIFNSNGVLTLIQKKQDMNYIKAKNGQIMRENQELRRKIKLLSENSDYLNVIIRDNLYMVRDGEILLKFTPQTGGKEKK